MSRNFLLTIVAKFSTLVCLISWKHHIVVVLYGTIIRIRHSERDTSMLNHESIPDNDVLKIGIGSKKKISRVFVYPIERMLAIHKFNSMYRELQQRESKQEIFDAALETLNVTYDMPEYGLNRLPKTGSALVVCNHPFGMIEGIILIKILKSIRPDFKIMANPFLSHFKELISFLIETDPFDTNYSKKLNVKGLRQAFQWLKKDHMLCIFPSGEVAHYDVKSRQVVESPWHQNLARIIRLAKCPVVPLYFDGTNSAFFHMAGLLHPRLRTALLPRQLLNKCNKEIRARIGQPILYNRLKAFESDTDLVDYLRFRTLNLKYSIVESNAKIPDVPIPLKKNLAPIIEAAPGELLAQEVVAIQDDQTLLVNGPYRVVYAKAAQIPNTLREIGRLREITFREVGEGTGKSVDLDRFDQHYYHLFVWHETDKQVVGAYRLGASDEILPRFGVSGFYTTILFKIKPKLISGMSPALELGRSFIQPKYQKVYSSLLLLWKGIGQFVVKNPQYKVMFGPVSISNDYNPMSRQLIIQFFELHHYLKHKAKLIKPNKRPKMDHNRKRKLKKNKNLTNNFNDLSALISDLEVDDKG
ncbi:lysophospholipid acyltransferase family protein, partial [bacterium]|nr:lysophospholipid acyltransferase family protein [bacterium]